VVAQFERERAQYKPQRQYAVGFVAAARFCGGQLIAATAIQAEALPVNETGTPRLGHEAQLDGNLRHFTPKK
jgi:hypothetical protein